MSQEEEPLETPEDNLGLAVNGCEKSPTGKHFPAMTTTRGIVQNPGQDEELYVIYANCVHCGLEGSRQVNPYSFNWD